MDASLIDLEVCERDQMQSSRVTLDVTDRLASKVRCFAALLELSVTVHFLFCSLIGTSLGDGATDWAELFRTSSIRKESI